jgi:hypothetical protein
MKPKIMSPKKQQGMIDRWNATVPIGTPCEVRMDDGAIKTLPTRSTAWLMGGHSAMVMLEGISGGFQLQRCKAL